MHTRFVATVALSALACFAQEQTGAKALFMDPTTGVSLQSSGGGSGTQARKAASRTTGGAAQPLAAQEGDVTGLRYWIELQTETGQLLRVNSRRAFKSGERIRLHVESNVDGSLVILQSQDGGPYARLFPAGNTAAGRVTRFSDQVIPSKNGWFRFDSKPGEIRLMVMVQADQGGDTLLVADTRGPQLEASMRRHIDILQGSKALVIEDDPATTEAATYVVADARRATDVQRGMVAVELKLSHH